MLPKKIGHKNIVLYCHKIVCARLFVQDYYRFDPRDLYYVVKNLASQLTKDSKDQTRFTNKNDPVARIYIIMGYVSRRSVKTLCVRTVTHVSSSPQKMCVHIVTDVSSSPQAVRAYCKTC